MSEASGKDGVDPVANSMGSDPHHGGTYVQYVHSSLRIYIYPCGISDIET